MPLDEEIRAE